MLKTIYLLSLALSCVLCVLIDSESKYDTSEKIDRFVRTFSLRHRELIFDGFRAPSSDLAKLLKVFESFKVKLKLQDMTLGAEAVAELAKNVQNVRALSIEDSSDDFSKVFEAMKNKKPEMSSLSLKNIKIDTASVSALATFLASSIVEEVSFSGIQYCHNFHELVLSCVSNILLTKLTFENFKFDDECVSSLIRGIEERTKECQTCDLEMFLELTLKSNELDGLKVTKLFDAISKFPHVKFVIEDNPVGDEAVLKFFDYQHGAANPSKIDFSCMDCGITDAGLLKIWKRYEDLMSKKTVSFNLLRNKISGSALMEIVPSFCYFPKKYKQVLLFLLFNPIEKKNMYFLAFTCLSHQSSNGRFIKTFEHPGVGSRMITNSFEMLLDSNLSIIQNSEEIKESNVEIFDIKRRRAPRNLTEIFSSL